MSFSTLLFEQLTLHPAKPWIRTNDRELTHAHVLNDVNTLKSTLTKNNCGCLENKVVGIAMKTSYEFIIADLLCLKEKAVTLPIPLEFEDNQIKSLLKNVDLILVRADSDADRLSSLLPEKLMVNVVNSKISGGKKHCINKTTVHENIVKIIHTSGTTSDPKGVLIKDEALKVLISSLLNVFPKKKLSYLTLVPLSLLVEQIFGIYCTLLTGGQLTILPENVNEFGGASDPSSVYLELIRQHQPNFMYLAPRLLEDLNKLPCPTGFSPDAYYVTGGAKVNPQTLHELNQKGIKVYEGYGLSETTSVVSINTPTAWRIGTAGRILPHLAYTISKQGELLLKGTTLCAGYFTKDDSACEIDADGYLHTGDIVEVDEDKYLTITGRKKNLLILCNARNISPEWVELKIKKHPEVNECVVVGEGEKFLTAIISATEDSKISSIISQVNSELPLFAQINRFIVVPDSEGFRKKYFTVTGRPRRPLIQKEYIHEI